MTCQWLPCFHSIQSLQLSFQNQSTPHMPHIIKVCATGSDGVYYTFLQSPPGNILHIFLPNKILHLLHSKKDVPSHSQDDDLLFPNKV